MNAIICMENVVLTHDRQRVVNGISCRIRENERITVCGSSGSDKNALMRLIAGMDKPSAGSVTVLNQAVHEMNRRKAASFRNQYIGVVLEEPGLVDKLNVVENVSLPHIIRGISHRGSKKEADALLNMLGIRHLAQALPAQLTAYDARVACIARALIMNPKILLLNNVTSRLSERDAERLIETIRVIVNDGDYTVLWFSDNAGRFDTDRTLHLENGKIREDIK